MAYVKDKETQLAENELARRRAAIDAYVEDKKLTDARSSVIDRKAFSYDATKDPLYLQARDSYKRLGKAAAADTMGKAASLNGGYGTSYGQVAGQQTYNQYMQQLNELLPELEGRARENYDAETSALMQKYSLLYGEDADRRSRDRSDYETALNLYMNQKNFDYGKYRDEVSDSQWQQQFELQSESERAANYANSLAAEAKLNESLKEDNVYAFDKISDIPEELMDKMRAMRRSSLGGTGLLEYLMTLEESGIISEKLSDAIYQTLK